jgi:hypothetical protein
MHRLPIATALHAAHAQTVVGHALKVGASNTTEIRRLLSTAIVFGALEAGY